MFSNLASAHIRQLEGELRDIFEHCCAKGAWYLPINLRLGRLTRKENLRKRRRPSLRSLCLRREGLLPPPSLRAHQLPKFPSFS